MKIIKIAMSALFIGALAVSPAFADSYASTFIPDGTSLTVVVTAQPGQVCLGQSTQLLVVATGGTSNYTFSWTSDPPGFNASSTDAVVTPVETTTYTVVVNDGITSSTASVTVTVNPLPRVDITPLFNTNIRETTSGIIGVCVFDSVTLDAGNPGSIYSWSNGSTEQMITAQSSGISYDLQEHSVTVTDPSTGCSNSNSKTVEFTFTDCTYGIADKPASRFMEVYPNPSSTGIFNLKIGSDMKSTEVRVFSSTGILVKTGVAGSLNNAGTILLDLSGQPEGIYFLRTAFTNQKLIILR